MILREMLVDDLDQVMEIEEELFSVHPSAPLVFSITLCAAPTAALFVCRGDE
mgnify:CR=1 FL=1